jgi:hypothetical protein
MAGRAARHSGALASITPWSLFLANALNGQVTLGNVADFTLERRAEFAQRLSRVSIDIDLSHMENENVKRVIDVCSFGFPGVWGPKITKVAALYRPKSIPVLDGYLAMAFGFSDEGFSKAAPERGLDRRERIRCSVQALRRALQDHGDALAYLRTALRQSGVETDDVADLRLIDMVIWTSQDDLQSRRGSPRDRWLNGPKKAHVPLSAFDPIPLT